ncbi:glutamate receptor 2.7-like [Oryza brachyantha]|uniref:glutamate receptor 2.7-like n=1 Tax=Oryza brachyantha TaxID=4533 RepID=UPI001ADC8B2F|nr:glutamate receptor 2.7-like [Oryza brachyantha]
MARRLLERSASSSSSSLFLILLFPLLAAALVVVTAQRNAPPVASVRVGVILTAGSPIGVRRRTGLQMAAEDYYAAHPGSATRVELHFRDSAAGDVLASASAAVDLIKNVQVQAIIGPPTSAEAEFVVHVGSHSHVPVLSYSATSPALSPVQTPFFVRTAVNDSFQAAPVAAVLDAFSWRAAAVVYEDSPYGSGILPSLADALQGVGAKITDRTAVPADATDDRLDALLYRLDAMPTRVFVVHMLYDVAGRFFRRAKMLGMMSKGYIWVATDGVATFMDRFSPEEVDTMQGVVSLRPYVQETDAVKNFSARFKARLRRDYPAVDDVREPTALRFWAYDTVWAIAAAAEEAGVASPAFQTPQTRMPLTDLDRLGVSATGAALLRSVLNTTFDGLAGKFRLVDGQLQPPAYEVVNILGRGPRTVGFWTPESGITQDLNAGSAARTLKQILWPGEPRETPKGWTVSPTGKPLRVDVPTKRGFTQFLDVGNVTLTGNRNITGYCIDMFDEVMKIMPYPVSYEYVPYPESSESYEKLVDQVSTQKADVVVGDVTITASRMEEVDFTMPFTESGWSMVVAVQKETSTSMWIFLQPLTTSLWLTSLAFFCFTGFVVWVIEHRINDEFRGTPWQQFGLIFYFAFSTLVFSHKEKLESNLSRFVVIIWVFVVLILTSSYTASLTSMLTVQKLQPTVTDVRELLRRGDYIGYQEGTFIVPLLEKMGFEGRMRSYSTADQYADALSKGSANGGVAAIFDEIPYLKLFLSQYCDGFTMVGPIYKTDGFGFVFPRGSPMVADVSRAILTLAETEKMAQIEKKWFGEPGACQSQGSAVGSSNLSFRSFGGLFLITGVVSTAMLLIYLATFFYREREKLRAAEAAAISGASGSGSPSIRRLRAWARHYDQRDPKSRTFKRSIDESVRNGSEYGNRTPRWGDESPFNGAGAGGDAGRIPEDAVVGMSPFSVSVSTSSERNNNAVSPPPTPGDMPASEFDGSFERGAVAGTSQPR